MLRSLSGLKKNTRIFLLVLAANSCAFLMSSFQSSGRPSSADTTADEPLPEEAGVPEEIAARSAALGVAAGLADAADDTGSLLNWIASAKAWPPDLGSEGPVSPVTCISTY